MLAYRYDEYTNEFIGTIQCQLNPIATKRDGKDVFLLPAFSTLINPTVKEGFKTVWNGESWDNVEIVEEKEEVYVPTLEEVKADKIAELKSARDTEELSPISCNGYSWDFDEKAQMRINGAITVLGDNTITWTTADNQEVVVNADDLKEIIGASAVRSNELHIKYRELKAQVESATTKAEVESIVW